MKISISTGAFYKYDYVEILDIIAQTTCKNIEIMLNQSFYSVPFCDIKREVEKRELNVLSIHAPIDPLIKKGETEKQHIEKCLELARLLGAELVVTHHVLDMSHIDLSKPFIGQDLKACKPLNDEHKENLIQYKNSDVVVTTENLPKLPVPTFLENADMLYRFIKTHDLKMTFDTTHWASSNKDIVAGYSLFKDYIRNIHISDNLNGVEHVALGAGDIDLCSFIKMLKYDGYSYSLTIELDLDNKKRNNISSKEQAIRYLQDSVDYIERCLSLKVL